MKSCGPPRLRKQADPAAQVEPDWNRRAGEPPRVTEEVTVTVTARKREKKPSQSVPLSVLAYIRNRSVESIEDVSANVADLGPEPRSRPEPDRDARRVGRPDRARPAGGQRAGRRLSVNER